MRCSLLVVAVLSCAAPTAAQDTLDTVRLRNGGIVRGTVLEYEPGGDVVIRSFAGEDRRISAAEVAEVRIGGDIVPVRPDAAAESPEAPAPTEEAPSQPARPTPTPEETGVARWEDPRDLSDGHGPDAPWYVAPPPPAAMPPGDVHVGLQVGGGVQWLAVPDWLTGSYAFARRGSAAFFSLDVLAVLDVWLVDALHLRVELGVHLGPGTRYEGSMGEEPAPLSAGPRVRLLAGFDLHDAFVLRVGPYGGVELFGERDGSTAMHFAGSFGSTTQGVFRLADEKRLELGLSIDTGFQFFPLNGSRGYLRTSFDLRVHFIGTYLF